MIAERSTQTYVEGRAVNLPGSDSQKKASALSPHNLQPAIGSTTETAIHPSKT